MKESGKRAKVPLDITVVGSNCLDEDGCHQCTRLRSVLTHTACASRYRACVLTCSVVPCFWHAGVGQSGTASFSNAIEPAIFLAEKVECCRSE